MTDIVQKLLSGPILGNFYRLSDHFRPMLGHLSIYFCHLLTTLQSIWDPFVLMQSWFKVPRINGHRVRNILKYASKIGLSFTSLDIRLT